MTDRLENIEARLEEHSAAIFGLQESTRRLEGGQERQAVAIQELSSGFGRVLRELGKVGEEYRIGKHELLATMHNLSDAVIKLDANQSAFRREQIGVCDNKHKHVEFRLNKVEAGNDEVVKEIVNMSETSKVQYIQNLEAKLIEYGKTEAQAQRERAADVRSEKAEKIRFVGILVGSLLTGGVGAILVRWLLGI